MLKCYKTWRFEKIFAIEAKEPIICDKSHKFFGSDVTGSSYSCFLFITAILMIRQETLTKTVIRSANP